MLCRYIIIAVVEIIQMFNQTSASLQPVRTCIALPSLGDRVDDEFLDAQRVACQHAPVGQRAEPTSVLVSA